MPMVKLKTSTTGILLLFYGIIQMEQIVDGMTNVGGVYAVIMKLHSVEHSACPLGIGWYQFTER